MPDMMPQPRKNEPPKPRNIHIRDRIVASVIWLALVVGCFALWIVIFMFLEGKL